MNDPGNIPASKDVVDLYFVKSDLKTVSPPTPEQKAEYDGYDTLDGDVACEENIPLGRQVE